MLNPDFSIFDDNMFVQVRQILDPVSININEPLLDFTVGEPRIAPPEWLTSVLVAESKNWQSYPKAFADDAFLADVSQYFKNRFPVLAGQFDVAEHIVPVPGTREPLHLLGYCVKGAKPDNIAFVTNPFYHAWRAGALAAGGKIGYINALSSTSFLADIDNVPEDDLRRCTIMYLCNPSNPHGAIAPEKYIEKAISLAREFEFLLVMDECYIDIWRNNRPISALEIAQNMDSPTSDKFSHLIVLNSLSKRSSAAGVRAGFLCGDRHVIAAYKKLVANGAALVPTPLLHVAGALYRDEDHNQLIRQFYDKSFEILAEHLQIKVPDGGFFLWMSCPDSFKGDDQEFTRQLFANAGIKTVPGSVMAVTHDGVNPGAGFVRLAIVHEHDLIEQAALRLSGMLGGL